MNTDAFAPPYRAPSGRGGFCRPDGSAFDPFFDFDAPQRIADLTAALTEHPAARPHLERWGLCYTSHPLGILVACARCSGSPCRCGDIAARCNEYMVNVYDDPELRPLFDAQRLAVRH